MRPAASPWLPPPGEGETEAAVRWLVRQWLADWTAEPPAPEDPEVSKAIPGAERHSVPEHARALGLIACAGRADIANPRDQRVLEAVGTEMLADLYDRAQGGERGGWPGIADARHVFHISSGRDGWRIVLSLTDEVLVQARKARAGTSARAPAKPLADALTPELVSLGCYLGQAQLTAGDVATLASGDVIVLDHTVRAPVPLTVEGGLTAGQARIAVEDGAVRITIAQSPSLQ